METSYFKKTGSIRYINPTDLLRYTYMEPKEEGFFVKEGQNGRWIGGWQDLTDSDIQQALGIDFASNNCCIRALFTNEAA